MKKFVLSLCIACACLSAAHAGDDIAARLVGTWVLQAHRHDYTVTYKSDGTYVSEGDGETTKGTWKVEGNKLIETPAGKDASPSSSAVEFETKDKINLEGLIFHRIVD